jgi:Tfp pilus assembly protein PilV
MESSATQQGVNMLKTTIATAVIAAGVLGLSGCDVKKTQEGHVQLPKYDVQKERSADVKMPKYDVTTPDVQVGSKETQVTVPKVETQKKTVEVPTVDVKTAKEKEQEQQKQMGAAGTSSSK